MKRYNIRGAPHEKEDGQFVFYNDIKSDRALLEEAVGLLEWCRHHAGYILYPVGVGEKEHNEQVQKIDSLISLLARTKEVLK